MLRPPYNSVHLYFVTNNIDDICFKNCVECLQILLKNALYPNRQYYHLLVIKERHLSGWPSNISQGIRNKAWCLQIVFYCSFTIIICHLLYKVMKNKINLLITWNHNDGMMWKPKRALYLLYKLTVGLNSYNIFYISYWWARGKLCQTSWL